MAEYPSKAFEKAPEKNSLTVVVGNIIDKELAKGLVEHAALIISM